MLRLVVFSFNPETQIPDLTSFLSICSETGGILLSPRPAPDDSPVKPEYPTRPFFGVKPVIFDEKVLHKIHNFSNVPI